MSLAVAGTLPIGVVSAGVHVGKGAVAPHSAAEFSFLADAAGNSCHRVGGSMELEIEREVLLVKRVWLSSGTARIVRRTAKMREVTSFTEVPRRTEISSATRRVRLMRLHPSRGGERVPYVPLELGVSFNHVLHRNVLQAQTRKITSIGMQFSPLPSDPLTGQFAGVKIAGTAEYRQCVDGFARYKEVPSQSTATHSKTTGERSQNP